MKPSKSKDSVILEHPPENTVAAYGLKLLGFELLGRSVERSKNPTELDPFTSDLVLQGLRKIVTEDEFAHGSASRMLSAYEELAVPIGLRER